MSNSIKSHCCSVELMEITLQTARTYYYAYFSFVRFGHAVFLIVLLKEPCHDPFWNIKSVQITFLLCGPIVYYISKNKQVEEKGNCSHSNRPCNRLWKTFRGGKVPNVFVIAIVAFLQTQLCVCSCVCLCVLLHDNSKINI